MTKNIWIGIERSADAAMGWRFDGAKVLQTATGPTPANVVAQLGDGPALIIGDGHSLQQVPAPVLPENLPLSGLSQEKPRGALCAAARLRIGGALADRKNWDGVICLPMPDATHWCQISADEVVSFQSSLTPVLARSLDASDHADPEAVADTMSHPERLSVHLRSASLMQAPDTVTGHLLGAELGAMRPYWLGQQVIVIAQNRLYSSVLEQQGVPVDHLHPQDCAQKGLFALWTKTR
ncbi:MAG: 2-dehydro-3-deoxygalactonokinase [Rhodobacterales bacterium]